MNEDMSQFLGVFLDEANEQMNLLEQEILKLEHESSQELLQVIFRAAHTLKGSSRAMGFTPMGELTHAMEDVFDMLRNDMLSVDQELIDALFAALDALKAMKDEIATSGCTTVDTTVETARLRAVLKGAQAETLEVRHSGRAATIPAQATASIAEISPDASGQSVTPSFRTVLSPTQIVAMQDAQASGFTLFLLRVQIAPDCIMKSVRAMMVLQTLDRVSSALASTPDEDGLENEEFGATFEIVVATQELSTALHTAVMSVNEVTGVEIVDWNSLENKAMSLVSDVQPSAMTEAPPVPILIHSEALTEGEDGSSTRRPSDRRTADVGPEGRGKSSDEVQVIAAEKKVITTQPQTVRVDVVRLDKLLNLVGELVIDRTRLARLGTQTNTCDFLEHLTDTAAHIGRITDELQTEIMKARMLPVDNVFSRFPRMIRDLAQKLGKEINFVVEGKETELDRSVIEVIGDPLIHMLRNSVDHGIEMPEERHAAGKELVGTVTLRARHQESYIVIEIEDDGKGLDPEKLRAIAVKKGAMTQEEANRLTDKEAIHLIFASGFSTAKVVSDVSGRGVGMDIVRSNLQKLGALIDIESKVGVGSTFTVKLPLTLAIVRGLLVNVDQCVYALPLNAVVETIQVDPASIHLVNRREVIHQRGTTLPLIRLREVFALGEIVTGSSSDPAIGVVRQSSKTPKLKAASRLSAKQRKARDLAAGIDAPIELSMSEPIIDSESGEWSMDEMALAQSPDSFLSESSPDRSSTDRIPMGEIVELRQKKAGELHYVVIVGSGDRQVGMIVDGLIGEQEVVIKSLGKFIGDIRGFSGATILGDGRVALIIDVDGLINIAVQERGKSYAA